MNYERYNLLIDSSKRQNQAEPSSSFHVNLSNSYLVKMARLKAAAIPQTWYNITASNNSFSYMFLDDADGSHTYIITLNPGRYSLIDILNNIVNQLSTQPTDYGTLTLTYENTSGRFIFTATGFIPGQGGVYLRMSPLLLYMGFYTNQVNFFGTTIEATNPCALIEQETTNFVAISISYLDTCVITIDNNQHNSTFLLQTYSDINGSYFGQTVATENIADDSGGGKNNVYPSPVQLQNFQVTLTDRNNAQLDLNSYDWWCLIELIVVVPEGNNSSQFIPHMYSNNTDSPSYMIQKQQTKPKPDLPLFMRV